VPDAEEQGAPPVPDEIHVAAQASIRYAVQVPRATLPEAQVAIRLAEQVPGATRL
jgi:hypothetical protein